MIGITGNGRERNDEEVKTRKNYGLRSGRRTGSGEKNGRALDSSGGDTK